MISSILYYLPPSVELLGLAISQSLNSDLGSPVFKPDWRRWIIQNITQRLFIKNSKVQLQSHRWPINI